MMRGGKATGKRKATDIFSGAPPPSVEHHRHHLNSRDSDASFASSRPSSIGLNRDPPSDRSHQIRSINTFLSSHSFPISLRASPVPPVKDISETLKFLLSTLDFPCDALKWDEDVVFFLRSVNCPFKLTKSTLRAPNSPHNWPNVLSVATWLVQYARFRHHLSAVTPPDDANSIESFGFQSFRLFIRNEDEMDRELESDFLGKLQAEKAGVAETIANREREALEVEAKLDSLKKDPTRKEKVERAKSDLEKDVAKFRTMVTERGERTRGIEKVVEEKEKEVAAKEEEKEGILEENRELRRSVEEQSFNVRDVERMRRELVAVERDVGEGEVVRDGWEQKAWELNSRISNLFHRIQGIGIDCNGAMRRLKLDVQFVVSESGVEGPGEVMGVDYKGVVKPALCSLLDGVKEASMKKVEELVALQEHASEVASKIEVRKRLLASIQEEISEVEEKMRLGKKEAEEFGARCDLDARTMAAGVKNEERSLEEVEKEAAKMLRDSEVRLEEEGKRSEAEVQAAAAKLFALIDSISKHKEYVDSKVLEVKTRVEDTAGAVSEIYKASFKKHLGGIDRE